MQQDQKKAKIKKLLMLMPLFLIPVGIIVYLVTTISGKPAPINQQTTVTGFNKNLPDPHLDKKEKNKLEIYMEAEKDSLKRKEQEAADPNIKRFYDPGPPENTAVTSPGNTRSIGKGNLPASGKLDANEIKVKEKLKQLYEAMNERSTGSRDTSFNRFTADQTTEKLERLASQMHRPDTGSDPQIRQISQMLDKVMDIQHPERVMNREHDLSIKDSRPFLPASVNSGEDLDEEKNLYRSEDGSSVPTSGFFLFATEETDSGAVKTAQTAIAAVIHETQTIESGATVKLRLLQDIFIAGVRVPRGNFLYGKAEITAQRVKIELTTASYNNQEFPVALKAYDAADGLEGISAKGGASLDLARQGMAQGMQGMQLATLDPSLAAQATAASIETAKALISRKVRAVKVTLNAGHKILLLNPQNLH